MAQPPSPPRPFADLTGRTAVITGSSSGIGRAIALELAAAGADVVIHCRRSRDRAEAVAGEVRALGRTAHILTADVGQESELTPFVEACLNALGKLDIWVNNAGADLLTGDAPKWTFEEKLEILLDVDVRSAVLLSRDVGRRMQEAGQGVILNIGWDQADRGMDGGGDSAELFSAAKNAIMGFTRSLAMTLAPAVRVNCIAPGWIRTAWGDGASNAWQERVLRETPLRRWGLPEDIARLARFLVSDEASFITGQVINSNGGAVR
ncbi:SDR family NAD(P)-dependent oxidoreductase [Planctomyces sp. SH-PL14]|uniref:SDR family NAD(P)-dependent oxidoreductase n=1 Tax=Planctomyces sp. SH-PL14 TaxID=1632864 RepID=UPI00078CF29C|nr:SDR family oxidoreductase [Planctomyces sp. SH-PL14]AMV17656.1 3-oxoacyl-[acyl-carrier-protein] reductase FabG [Planctomyces sp. SH-PL14]